MGTRTLIGSTEPDRRRYTARWLHCGDTPERLIPILRQIWTATFGSSEPLLMEALLAHDWSELSADARDGHRPGLHAIPGVGYTTDSPQDQQLWTGAVTDPLEQMLEWLYLIDGRTSQIHVYEATVHHRWLLHSSHHLDSAHADAVLGCGGHRYKGHRWEPAKVRWEGYAPIWDAEICAGRHLGGHTIARFTDDVAQQIAAHTEATGTIAGGASAPYLHFGVTEFNLCWHDDTGYGDQLHVERDQDDRLLIGPYLLPWQRVEG